MHRQRPEVGVRIAVRNHREGGAPEPGDVERRPEASGPAADERRHSAQVRDVAGTAPVVGAAQRIDPPDELRREANPRAEPEAPPVHAPERDSTGSLLLERVRDLPGRSDRVTRQAECSRRDARAAAGQEADDRVRPEAVQHLVRGAVAAEDDHRLDLGRRGQLGRVAWVLRQQRQLRREHLFDQAHPLLGHVRRERVDDQDGLHGGIVCRANHYAAAS